MVDSVAEENVNQRTFSQMDARVANVGLPSTTRGQHENWYYEMKKKGLAVIFNHFEYDTDGKIRVPARVGTNFDARRLKTALEDLNFDVSVKNDYKVNQIRQEIKKITETDRSTISCLIIVVMTHGENGYLRAADSDYKIDLLWDSLTNKECPNLIGVPKLYFIQACRGDKVDSGVKLQYQGGNVVTDGSMTSPPKTYKLPSMADILQMYSTYQDYSSWRENDGTWFIQSLCEVLETEAEFWDLLQLLTFVNRKVAVEYESYTLDKQTNEMKQIPQIVSMLTKLLRFKRGSHLM